MDFFAGALTGERLAALESHLDGCQSCALSGSTLINAFRAPGRSLRWSAKPARTPIVLPLQKALPGSLPAADLVLRPAGQRRTALDGWLVEDGASRSRSRGVDGFDPRLMGLAGELAVPDGRRS
jgi:putative zinc finger protein